MKRTIPVACAALSDATRYLKLDVWPTSGRSSAALGWRDTGRASALSRRRRAAAVALGLALFSLPARAGVLASGPSVTLLDEPGTFTGDAALGDTNGDGYDDAAIADGERAHLLYGSAAGLPTGAPEGEPYEMGRNVRAAGDVDGDCYDDVAFGAREGDTAPMVYVVRGSPDGLEAEPSGRVGDEPGTNGENPATLAVEGGDVNGDGFGDLYVSPNFVYFGQADSALAVYPPTDRCTPASTPEASPEATPEDETGRCQTAGPPARWWLPALGAAVARRRVPGRASLLAALLGGCAPGHGRR